MRALKYITPLILLMLVLMVWQLNLLTALEHWAMSGQRLFQNKMATALRALRAGEAGAIFQLSALAFTYGFFHAVGPGHGKFLIGGYGLARGVSFLKLSAISLASSLLQAVGAIVLVFGGLWIFGLTRADMTDAAEGIMAPLSYAMITVLGIWLALRGARKLWRRKRQSCGHSHASSEDHNHSHADICPDCGHKHGPTADDIENTGTLKEALLLIGAIAMRPCTGALFLLIISWRMGFAYAGIIGTLSMGLGTGLVTVTVAGLSIFTRGQLLIGDRQSARFATWAALIEIAAGVSVATIAAVLFLSIR